MEVCGEGNNVTDLGEVKKKIDALSQRMDAIEGPSGEDRRFHLSYEYTNPEKGWKNSGDQVVHASSIEQAVKQIARNIDLEGLKEITVKKRHFSGKPASESEVIGKAFKVG